MNCKQAEKIIKDDGWFLDSVVGSHHHYKHRTKSGKVTIPFHGKDELPPKTVNSIMRQPGLK